MESGSLLTAEQNEVLVLSIARLVRGLDQPSTEVAVMEVEERSSEYVDYNYKIQINKQIVEAAQDSLVIFSKAHPELIFSLIIPKLLEAIGPEQFQNNSTPVTDSLKALVLLSGTSSGLFKSIMLSLMGLLYSNVNNIRFLELILETATDSIFGVGSQLNGQVCIISITNS